jgi:glycerol-1-phosphatase
VGGVAPAIRRGEVIPRGTRPIADAFDGFLIDLDGVVYVGKLAIPGSVEALQLLGRNGKEVIFLTNDPRHSRRYYADKLRGFGLKVPPSRIVTSAAATAAYIGQQEETANRSAFVIGSSALKAEIRATGLTVVDAERGREADLVVVGGHDRFDYAELRTASQAVRRGAAFYAAGRDATFPMPDGPWPATGAILAAVETAAAQRARVIGKPEPAMFRVAQGLFRGTPRTVVIGDRLDSDVAGGRRAGLATVLVLTGSTTEAEAARAHPAPDFVIRDLMGLVT